MTPIKRGAPPPEKTPKQKLYYLLGKSPLILAFLVGPITLWFVFSVNDSLRRFLAPPPKPEPAPAEAPMVDEGPELVDPTESLDPDRGKRRTPESGYGGREAFPDEGYDVSSKNMPPKDPDEGLFPDPPEDGDWERAAAECKTAESLHLLGRAALGVGDETTANRFFRDALRKDPDYSRSRRMLGHVRYDPARHLEGFKDYEGRQLEGELCAFRKDLGAWLDPIGLDHRRREWAVVKTRLDAELEIRRNDPLDDRRRRHLLRLLGDPFYAEMLRKGRLITRRPHPAWMLFIEAHNEKELTRMGSFEQIIVRDLDRVVETFREECLGRNGDDAWEERFFVWILKSKDFAVHLNMDQGRVVIHRPPTLTRFDRAEGRRREVVLAFARLLVDRYADRAGESGPGGWIRIGMAELYAMGKGLTDDGGLRMHGEGIRRHSGLKKWIRFNDGAWPLPLDVLLDVADHDELWAACETRIFVKNAQVLNLSRQERFDGAVLACALLCRQLRDESKPKAFRSFLAKRFAGDAYFGDLDELMGGESLMSLERAITTRFGN